MTQSNREEPFRVTNASERAAVRQPVIALMTDFGLRDGFVGIMKGVIAGIVPHAQLIDISHDIAPQNVAAGAWLLSTAYRYFPAGSIFLCVVDPGVGSQRRAIALEAGDWFFVGPDNGLFSYVLAEQPVRQAVALENPAYRLPVVSTTFHGRDIFAPAAAHLARGVPLADFGTILEPHALQRLALNLPRREGGRIEASVIYIDHFGNLVTSIPLTLVPDLFTAPRVRLLVPQHNLTIERRQPFFAGEAGEDEPFVYSDSAGYVGIAIRNGNAAARLGMSVGEAVTLVIEES
ncbi:SAM hydrolase/SAM-dependent halogenase family protein [Thermogemmatispora sp.]|uniref:SAM hydrolase/SAM-dependent halogenase family protein n=1 Tax=Thermogemmatispora sp. TaxID=1968838 RepID=UPI001DFD9D36|nr:SAM-dependent chlorinase/fluorinase [Thermogemmatispora sp.]MBX5450188.1 SAM-dependent chlorinase/fluorinase [Thermogemmatispora sp.]